MTDNIRTSAYTKRPQAVSQRMCYTLCTCSKRSRRRSVSIRAAAARSWWRQRPSSVLRFARHCAGASVRDRLASAVPAKRPRTKRHDPHIRARAGPTTRCTRLGGRHFARLDAPLAGRNRSDRERRRQPRLFFCLHLSLDWKNFFSAEAAVHRWCSGWPAWLKGSTRTAGSEYTAQQISRTGATVSVAIECILLSICSTVIK